MAGEQFYCSPAPCRTTEAIEHLAESLMRRNGHSSVRDPPSKLFFYD
jgi:hypothetical protein